LGLREALVLIGAVAPILVVGGAIMASKFTDPPEEGARARSASPLYEEAYKCAEKKGLRRQTVDTLAYHAKSMVNYVIRKLEDGVEGAFAKYMDHVEEGIKEAKDEAIRTLDRVMSDVQEWYNIISEKIESLGFKPPLTKEDMDSIRRDVMRLRDMMERKMPDYDIRRYINTVLARWYDRKYTLVAEAMLKAGLLSCP
jgi:hypothetical protein